jgi:hypothetical protein
LMSPLLASYLKTPYIRIYTAIITKFTNY